MADTSDFAIIKGGALGDTLMVLPSICDMPRQCRVFFVGREPGLYFISLRTWAVSNMDASPWHMLFTEAAELSSKLKNAFSRPVPSGDWEPRAVAVFTKDPQGRLQQRLRRLFGRATVKVFPPFPEEGHGLHTAFHTALCLRDAGFPLDPVRAMDRAGKAALIPRMEGVPVQRKDIVIHPGSGGREKNYPTSFWIRLLEESAGRGISARSLPAVLIGPAELEKEWEFRKAEERGLCRVSVIKERGDLYRMLSSAGFFLGHDSGVTHLAAMMGVPTAALFRKSSRTLWRPIGPFVSVFPEKEDTAILMDEVMEVLSCNAGETAV